MFRSFLFLCLCLCSTSTWAYLLQGIITDTEGVPIPYVNVYLEHTTIGVVSNVKGEYFLELDAGDYRLVFHRIGFTRQTIDVSISGHQRKNVVMEISAYELDSVNITIGKKDPAYEIMKQVIANKKEYVKQFDSYKCNTYLKVALETDTMPTKRELRQMTAAQLDSSHQASKERPKLNFIESHSTTYYQFPKTYKSIVHAYRDFAEEKNMGVQMQLGEDGMQIDDSPATEEKNPYLFYMDVSDADFNFYRNLIEALDLGDRPFISPLNSTMWRVIYKYKLEETFMENGWLVHKIKVTPRNQDGPYFSGDLYIMDKSWAIKSVNLQIVPSTLSFFSYFQVIHQYDRTPDGRWTLAKEDYYYNIKDGRVRFYGNTIALHTDYTLDLQHPKNFFRNEIRRVEKEALEKDSAFWASTRPITLKANEVEYIRTQDSIITYHNSPEFLRTQDSAYNRLKFWDFILNGVGFRDRPRGMEYFFDPLIAQPQFAGVGGYRHRLGGHITKTWKKYNAMHVRGQIDYGFNNEDVKGMIRTGYTYAPRRFGRAYVKFGNVYSMITTFQSIQAIFSRSNFIQKIFYGMGNRIEVTNGLYVDASVEFADRRSIEGIQLAEWSDSLFGSLNTPVSFEGEKKFLFDLKLTWQPGQKYIMEPYRKVVRGSKWPTFDLHYKKAIPGIGGSIVEFDFLEVSAEHTFRPGTMGISRWSFHAGKFFRPRFLGISDFKFFRGSTPYFFANPLADFQLLDATYPAENGFIQANYIHDFGGALMDKIPLLKRTRLQTAGGGAVVYIPQEDLLHNEIYYGLHWPFRIKEQRFRIGVYYSIAYSTRDLGITQQPKIGITFFNTAKNEWEY